jgi:hypothetical protein
MDNFPEKTQADVGYAIVKMAVGAIPVAGSAAPVFMEQIGTPVDRRRENGLCS